jgi:hypothetical protein
MLGFLLAISVVLDPSGSFRVSGWVDLAGTSSQRYPEIFSVHVDTPGVPPLLGSYSTQRGELVFTPRYPLQPGVSYRVTLDVPGQQTIVQRFIIPKRETKPTTVVEHVFPSSSLLPENQLKFYIHFSSPMSRGEAYRRIHLLDENGSPVELPFLELSQELWDQDGGRFTLYFDPGRIKSGLVPHNQSGMPIREGRKYTLVIDREWHDGNGETLKEGFRKSFSVGPAERHAIELSAWKIAAPKAGTSVPVTLEFPRPLDRALLEHEITVIDRSGDRIEGSIEIDRDESRWRLAPGASWKAGTYTLRVGALLADLAGNMVGRPFEIDALDNEKNRGQTVEFLFFEVQK